nr:MAG TPA: hypothetical protein [Caudoviricetes sp.]
MRIKVIFLRLFLEDFGIKAFILLQDFAQT